LKLISPPRLINSQIFKNYHLLKLFSALQHLPTNNNWERRRGILTKAMGLNFSSRYIKLMLEHCKILMDQWDEGTELDFIPTMYKLTLTVISSILLGRDFDK